MRFSAAILISIAVHVLVGLGIWLYLEYAPAPDVSATLDLTSVELSFADTEDDSAAVVPQLPAPDLPKPDETPEIRQSDNPEIKQPEIPDAVDIPKPAEERPNIQTPEQPNVSAPAPRQARVDVPPRPNRAIRPDYPKGSRQRGEQGDVIVELLVNEKGSVDKATVVTSSGFPELDEAAIRAVSNAKFSPAKSGNTSVSSTARITLTFKLK